MRATCTSSCRARSAGARRSHDTIRLARLARETGLFPVFEAEHGEVTRVHARSGTACRSRSTCEPQQRFAHLFGPKGHAEMLARIQADADQNIRRYGLLDEEATA